MYFFDLSVSVQEYIDLLSKKAKSNFADKINKNVQCGREYTLTDKCKFYIRYELNNNIIFLYI